MLTIRLEKPSKPDMSRYPEKWVAILVTTLNANRERGGKIFNTRFIIGNRNFLLTTTSKDLNLSLSEMSEDGLAALCCMLEEGFTAGERRILLIDPEPKKGILVIPVQPESGGSTQYHYVFHLSPA